MKRLLPLSVLAGLMAWPTAGAWAGAASGDGKTVITTKSSADEKPVEGFGPPAGGWPAKPPVGFRARVPVNGVQSKRAFYHLAVPEEYTPQQTWPVVIVLHGGPGGAADNLVPVFRGGLLKRGVISIYPQALRAVLLEWNYPHEGQYLLRIIRQVAATYRVDPARVYLVGHSMGGGGAWAQGAALRDVWAGVGPISGWYAANPRPDPKWLKDLPIYFLHGTEDNAVTVENSRQAFKALQSVGNSIVKYADFPDPEKMGNEINVYREVQGAGHAVFEPWASRGAKETGLLVAWLLKQKRAAPPDLAAAAKRLAEWGKAFHWTPEGGVLGKYADGTQVAENDETPDPGEGDADTALAQKLHEQFQQKDYAGAEVTVRKLVEQDPQSSTHRYNLACALARQAKNADALDALAAAVERGYDDLGHMQEDEDLAALREEARYKEMTARLREATTPKTEVRDGVRLITAAPEKGLRYRLRLSAQATAERPHRLVVWLHPSGGSGNQMAEGLSEHFLTRGFALLVFTQKNWAGWSDVDAKRAMVTVDSLAGVEGLQATRPILMGFSAGGQVALSIWKAKPAWVGGMILDAAYPVDMEAYRRREAKACPPPEHETIRTCPVISFCGGKDGGAKVWAAAVATWPQAGVPLVYHEVPGRGHEWLLGREQVKLLDSWLESVAKGEYPGGKVVGGEPNEGAAKK